MSTTKDIRSRMEYCIGLYFVSPSYESQFATLGEQNLGEDDPKFKSSILDNSQNNRRTISLVTPSPYWEYDAPLLTLREMVIPEPGAIFHEGNEYFKGNIHNSGWFSQLVYARFSQNEENGGNPYRAIVQVRSQPRGYFSVPSTILTENGFQSISTDGGDSPINKDISLESPEWKLVHRFRKTGLLALGLTRIKSYKNSQGKMVTEIVDF